MIDFLILTMVLSLMVSLILAVGIVMTQSKQRSQLKRWIERKGA